MVYHHVSDQNLQFVGKFIFGEAQFRDSMVNPSFFAVTLHFLPIPTVCHMSRLGLVFPQSQSTSSLLPRRLHGRIQGHRTCAKKKRGS